MSKLTQAALGEVSNNFNNVRVPLSVKQRGNLAKNYRYYGAQGVIDYVDNYLFDGEYILVAEDGENLKSQKNNICNYVTGKFWVNNHAHIINAASGNDTKYLYYKLNLVNFRNYVTGSAQPKLTKDNLNSIILHIHKEDEQKRIAAVLSVLDAKIDCDNRINAELETMTKTLYDYWFVQFDFPDANGKPYKSSGGKMVYNTTLKREIPEGWGVDWLGNLTSLIRRGLSPNYVELGGVLVLNQKCIREQRVSFLDAKRHAVVLEAENERLLRPFDVLINSTGVGTLGRIAFVKRLSEEKTTVDSHVTIVRADSKKIHTEYLAWTVLHFQSVIEAAANGSTGQVELNKAFIEDLNIIVPDSMLQEHFSIFVNPLVKVLAAREKEMEQLTQLRDWLLPLLMNGQVTVA